MSIREVAEGIRESYGKNKREALDSALNQVQGFALGRWDRSQMREEEVPRFTRDTSHDFLFFMVRCGKTWGKRSDKYHGDQWRKVRAQEKRLFEKQKVASVSQK